jgi:hypothetical protein
VNAHLSADRTTIRPRSNLTASLPAGAAAPRGGPYAGAAALAALQAWVWSSSLVPKLTSTTFVHGSAGFITQVTQAGQSGWYDAVLQRLSVAAPPLVAIEYLVVGLSLAGAAVSLAMSPRLDAELSGGRRGRWSSPRSR